jgi:hypothetical protein
VNTIIFYINKLIQAQLLPVGINSAYENLFKIGVDPEISAELDRSNIMLVFGLLAISKI